MRNLLVLGLAALLVACGGSGDPASGFNEPKAFKLASTVSGDTEIALHIHQALYGKAPSFGQLNTFKSQIAQYGAAYWVNAKASNFDHLSNVAFATLVLNNISITETSLSGTATFGTPKQAYQGLLAGFVDYLTLVGKDNRGVVAAQLTKIISNLEVDTQFGVYGPAAIALNKQIALNNTFSSNPANSEVTGPKVQTLAGSRNSGFVDGSSSAASFWADGEGISVDSKGNIYVSDTVNKAVRKLSTSGEVSTIAVTLENLSFRRPGSLVVNADGTNLYVVGGQAIYKLNPALSVDKTFPPAGAVSLIAGNSDAAGSPKDGAGSEARFVSLRGIALDSVGNLYVTDFNTIRKVTPAGVVSTLAGLPSPFSGFGGCSLADGIGVAATFCRPQGLTVDAAGNLYVADTGNHAIRKVTPEGVVTTVYGGVANGSMGGTSNDARLDRPVSIALAPDGSIYVVEENRQGVIRKIDPNGALATYAGTKGLYLDITDGDANSASFNRLHGMSTNGSGKLFVFDSGLVIRTITP